MKKIYTTLCFMLLCFSATHAQSQTDTEIIVRKIADNILKEAEFKFEGVENKQIYASTKDIPENVEVKHKGDYGKWHYTNGVLNMAMLNLGDYLKEDKYTNYSLQHVAFGFANYKYFEQHFKHDRLHYKYPFGEMFTMEELDDFGAMSASILEVYKKASLPEYKAYIEKGAKHLMKERLRMDDGTLVRKGPAKNTLWADDLYMSVPFLVRMGEFTNDATYTNDAIVQVQNFNKYLWNDQKELYYHCYYTDLKRNGVAHWGRCNGWMMLSQVHLLNHLPANHPQREALIKNLERQILGIAKYQNADGLWHQVLDKNDSYLESSCSAMFVYGIASAVNNGWIDKRYASIAMQGWQGLKKKMITEEGKMKDVCVGTGIEDDISFYYNRPTMLNDLHGTGALLDAGLEMMKLEKGLKK